MCNAVDIDEDTLKQIAQKTAADITRDNSILCTSIYADIDRLEKTEARG